MNCPRVVVPAVLFACSVCYRLYLWVTAPPELRVLGPHPPARNAPAGGKGIPQFGDFFGDGPDKE